RSPVNKSGAARPTAAPHSEKTAKPRAGSAAAAPPEKKATPAPPSDNPQAAAAKAPGMPSDAAAPPADKPILGLAPSPASGLSIGAYGEIKFGTMQNPAANGQWQNGFDAARMVLLPTYAITDNIIFNAEIEFEHAGA